MNKYLIPPINSRGHFKSTDPYNRSLLENVEHNVVAIRSLTELEASNENPLVHVYEKVGLTKIEYHMDLNNDVPIVVLQDSSDRFIYVPANQLLSIPKVSGYKYQELVLSVIIGPTNDQTDLTNMIIDMSSLIEGNIGIIPGIEINKASAVTMLSENEHNLLVGERLSAIVGKSTCYIQLQQALTREENYKKTIVDLECVIKENITL